METTTPISAHAVLAGGHVCKDRIECPFHGSQFTGDGRAASVPYSDTVSTRVATESFPVQKVHGPIFMYHRGCGARQQAGEWAGEEVPYPVPRIPEVDDGTFVFLPYTVISPDGEWLGQVEDSARFRVLDVTGGLVLGVLADEIAPRCT